MRDSESDAARVAAARALLYQGRRRHENQSHFMRNVLAASQIVSLTPRRLRRVSYALSQMSAPFPRRTVEPIPPVVVVTASSEASFDRRHE